MPRFVIFSFLDCNYFRMCEGVLALWFYFAFPSWLMKFDIFSSAPWPFVCLVWRTVYSSPLSIFKIGLFVFLLMSCKSSWCNLVKDSSVHNVHIFSSILWAVFSLSGLHLLMQKVCNFKEIQFTYFFFCCLCFGVRSKTPLLNPRLWRLITMFYWRVYTVVPWCLWGIGSRTPRDDKIHGCWSLVQKGIVFAYNLGTSSCTLYL